MIGLVKSLDNRIKKLLDRGKQLEAIIVKLNNNETLEAEEINTVHKIIAKQES